MRRLFMFLPVVLISIIVLLASARPALTETSVVDSSGDVGRQPAITVINGLPVISYYGASTQRLKIAQCQTVDCATADVRDMDTTSFNGLFSDITSVGNRPLVAYISQATRLPYVMACLNAPCSLNVSRSTLDTGTNLADGSIAVTTNGTAVFVAYYDNGGTGGALSYIYCQDSDCETWSPKFIDFNVGADPGSHVDIALIGGFPVISYFAGNATALKVARCLDLNCDQVDIALVDSDGDVGYFAAMTVIGGLPVISYYDLTNGDLKLAACGNVNCSQVTTTVVDSLNNVGQYTSITSVAGLPVISYFDVTATNLKIARCQSVDCATATLYTADSSGNVGAGTAITQVAGVPVVAYYDADNADLKVYSDNPPTLDTNSTLTVPGIVGAPNVINTTLLSASDTEGTNAPNALPSRTPPVFVTLWLNTPIPEATVDVVLAPAVINPQSSVTTDYTNDLLFTVVSGPTNGTLSLPTTFRQSDIAAGLLTYTLTNALATTDSFSFTVSDWINTVGPFTFNINLTATPTPSGVTSTRTPTATLITPTATPITPTDTPTATPTNTHTPTLTDTATNTPTFTFTPTDTATNTFTPTATFTPSETFTPTATFTPSETFTPTATFTPSETFTPTNTFTPSFTPSDTFTPTATFTPSETFTPTPTFTPSDTFTPTNTFTPTFTFTPTDTATTTFTPTFTFTPTDTATTTSTPTNTSTPTASFTPSNTPTQTLIPSATATQALPIYTSNPAPGSLISISAQPGLAATGSLQITNTGGGTLTIVGMNLAGSSQISLISSSTFSLGTGITQIVSIQCASPTSGGFTAVLQVFHNAPLGTTATYSVVCNVGVAQTVVTATPVGFVASPTPLPPGAASPIPPAVPPTGNVVEVRGLAIRTGPYLNATLMGVARPGTTYTVVARNLDEGEFTWYLILFGRNQQGWVSGRYFRISGTESLAPFAGSIFDQIDGSPDVGVRATTRAIIDLRPRPTGRIQPIATIPIGVELIVVGRTVQNGGTFWLHVRYGDLIGWIPAAPVTLRGDVTLLPVR